MPQMKMHLIKGIFDNDAPITMPLVKMQSIIMQS